MGKILSVCLVGYFVFFICQSAVAISANTERICRSGGYADSVACQLYKSGFLSSSSMACDMCVSIMGCISDYLSSGIGVSRAIQLCRETGFDGGDMGMIMDIIAEDALNLDADLSSGDFDGVCKQYSFCVCWPGTYGSAGHSIYCKDCPASGWSDQDSVSITQCFLQAGEFSDTAGSGILSGRCYYSE